MAYSNQKKLEEELAEQPVSAVGNVSGVVPSAVDGPVADGAEVYDAGPDEVVTAAGVVVPQSEGTTRAAGGSGDIGAGMTAAQRAEAERAAESADLEDWYRYVPKPDYETLARRARRQEQAALLGDIAQIAGQFYGTEGKNGGWVVQPLGNRYAKAREKRDAVEAQKRAAWQDYGGKQLSYLMNRRKERAAAAAAEQKARMDYNRFLLDYNYKTAEHNRRTKADDRNEEYRKNRLNFEGKQFEHRVNNDNARNQIARDRNQIAEKKGRGNPIKLYVGIGADGKERYVEMSHRTYNNAAGHVWRIMEGKVEGLEEKFKRWVQGDVEKQLEDTSNMSEKELQTLEFLTSALKKGNTNQLKTPRNILNFAQTLNDQDVYDFFIAMAGQGNTSVGGPAPGGAGASASGVSRAGTPVSRYYDAYMGGGNMPPLLDPNFK